ncbi:MAG: YIP1 family protein [Pseudomonadota bacterium]
MISVLGDFARFMGQGIAAPRATVRGMLNGGHGFDIALTMIALGYLIESVLIKLLVPGATEGANPIGFHMLNIVGTACGFFILSGLAYWIGSLFGGIATLAQSQLAVAWFMLMNSLLAPFAVMSLPEDFRKPPTDPNLPMDLSDANPTVIFIVVGIAIWLFASAVAEAHGFKSVWRVAGVILAIPMTLVFLLNLIVAGA